MVDYSTCESHIFSLMIVQMICSEREQTVRADPCHMRLSTGERPIRFSSRSQISTHMGGRCSHCEYSMLTCFINPYASADCFMCYCSALAVSMHYVVYCLFDMSVSL